MSISAIVLECSPGTDNTWSDLTLSIGDETALNDYTFLTKHLTGYTTPDDEDEVPQPIYGSFILVSQSISLAASGPPTDRDVGNVSFYTPAPGTYNGATNPNPPPDYIGTPAVSGITNGSVYNYIDIFNQGEFSYIPRLCPANDPSIETTGKFPDTPEINDPANGIYPVNQVTEFAPDDRREVTLTFTVTTVYKEAADEDAITATSTITQKVLQSFDNIGPYLQALLNNSYYGQGKFGIDQWPVDEPRLYNADETANPPTPRADVLIIDASTESGYAEYNQATYGAGFPYKPDDEILAIPDIPETTIDDDGEGVEIPGVDYTSRTIFDRSKVPFPDAYV